CLPEQTLSLPGRWAGREVRRGVHEELAEAVPLEFIPQNTRPPPGDCPCRGPGVRTTIQPVPSPRRIPGVCPMTRLGVLIGCCLAACLLTPLSAKDRAGRLRVPSGFVIDRVAGEPDVVFPMFAVFDDRGRLFVAESSGLDLYAELQALTRKCRISVLDDPDDKGRFRKAHVFADKLVFPMGLAWRDGQLSVADPHALV